MTVEIEIQGLSARKKGLSSRFRLLSPLFRPFGWLICPSERVR